MIFVHCTNSLGIRKKFFELSYCSQCNIWLLNVLHRSVTFQIFWGQTFENFSYGNGILHVARAKKYINQDAQLRYMKFHIEVSAHA